MNSRFAQYLHEVVLKTWGFSGRLITKRDEETNAILGLVGEAGEIADVHKKLWFHTHKDRREELILEVGDLLYYLTIFLHLNDIDVEECLEKNKQKLMKRYPEHFSEVVNE